MAIYELHRALAADHIARLVQEAAAESLARQARHDVRRVSVRERIARTVAALRFEGNARPRMNLTECADGPSLGAVWK